MVLDFHTYLEEKNVHYCQSLLDIEYGVKDVLINQWSRDLLQVTLKGL